MFREWRRHPGVRDTGLCWPQRKGVTHRGPHATAIHQRAPSALLLSHLLRGWRSASRRPDSESCSGGKNGYVRPRILDKVIHDAVANLHPRVRGEGAGPHADGQPRLNTEARQVVVYSDGVEETRTGSGV